MSILQLLNDVSHLTFTSALLIMLFVIMRSYRRPSRAWRISLAALLMTAIATAIASTMLVLNLFGALR
jgi:hypothetical protein